MKRQKHSLSHHVITSTQPGILTPVGCYEVLPGDTIQQATTVFCRVAPLNTPVMHQYTVRVHHWFVPHRLVWANWENFITGGPSGTDASVIPYLAAGATRNTSGLDALDYLGAPAVSPNPFNVNIMPLRGLNLIWNEWYRDQDLQTALTVPTTDGSDTTSPTTLPAVNFDKDYFTTARPWTQKGADVSIPLTGDASVKYQTGNTQLARNYNTGALLPSASTFATDSSGDIEIGGTPALIDPNGSLYADLSTATGADINALRHALALQRYEEARARYGSRYTEYLRYLGVRSSDARLQRPEYLGGGRASIQFSEVLQTGVTTSGTPTTGVGNLQGHGISASRSNRFRRFFEEHGYVFSLVSIVPRNVYGSALPRHFLYQSKEDFFQKELEHIGQQAITLGEVSIGAVNPTNVFGYQDRYDYYRRIWSYVSGYMRTSSLDIWHSARLFMSSYNPLLNSGFVTCADPERIYQDFIGMQSMQLMCMHSIQARRIVGKSATAFAL